MRLRALLWLLLASRCCFAQGSEQKVSYTRQLPGTNLIDSMNLISRQLTFITPVQSLQYAQQAYRLAIQGNYTKGLADAHRNLGSIYSHLGSYGFASEYVQRALQLYASMEDSSGIANCYITLGHMYRYLGDISKEIDYHKRAYEIHSRLKDYERIGVTAHNTGESYYNNKELGKALELTRLAIAINDSIGNLQVLASCYKVMGNIKMAEGQLSEAESWFKKVLVIADSLKEHAQKMATVEAYIRLADICRQKQDRKQYQHYLTAAAAYSNRYKLTAYYRQINYPLISLYVETGQLQKAKEFIRISQAASDSMYVKEVAEKRQLISSLYELYGVENKYEVLQLENQLAAARIKRKNEIIWRTSLFLCVLLLSLVLLWRMNRKLKTAHKEIKMQKDQLEVQNEELQRLNRTKDKFFGIISHDIRGPLHAVSDFMNLLLAGRLKALPEEKINTYLAESKKMLDNVKELTDDLLLWARLQMRSMAVHPECFPADGIIEEIIALYRDAASKKTIDICHTANPGLMVFADAHHFKFIIRNLVANAIKFTPSNGRITIGCQLVNEATVEITVADSGIGMSEAYVQSLLHLGSAESRRGTAGEPGSGLGLQLVLEFVKLNKGSVGAQSAVDQGSVFIVNLPGVPG